MKYKENVGELEGTSITQSSSFALVDSPFEAKSCILRR